jgi:hypothetical protein
MYYVLNGDMFMDIVKLCKNLTPYSQAYGKKFYESLS